jgi:hypothetical protein
MLGLLGGILFWLFKAALIGLVGLISFVSLWKIFNKAGRSGWALLVPIYNVMVLLRIAGRPAWWVLLLWIPGLNLFLLALAAISMAKRFGRGFRFGLGLFFLFPLFLPALAFSNLQYRRPAA